MLDEASARYPWELLENAYDADGRPVALNRGLLRQFEIKVFREAPMRSLGNDVLVVGDPVLPENGPLKRLPGARDEASAVADRLDRSRRFKVTRRIEASAKEIVQAFFARPYRMVHLAGHGVYEWQEPVKPADGAAASTPAQRRHADGHRHGHRRRRLSHARRSQADAARARARLHQLLPSRLHRGPRAHARRKRRSRVRRRGLRRSPTITSSLPTSRREFIRMGVRAVIAAGWAVDDAAGKTFAEAFYGAMLDGEPFGKAVEAARSETHNRHSYANTWGAYQCYGDPGFRIVERDEDEGGRDTDYASVEEMISRIENIEAECETRGGKAIGAQLEELESLQKALQASDWKDSGRAWATLGRAWNRAFQFETAIDCFYRAIGCEDGGLTARDLEQLSNCESRAAVAQWKADQKAASVDAIRKRIDVAIARLLALVKLPIGVKKDDQGQDIPAGQPETRERYSLLGSAYKRKAWIAAPSERVEPLGEMRDWYRKATDRTRTSGGSLAYPTLNWIAALMVLDWHGTPIPAEDRKRAEAEMAELLPHLQRKVQSRADMWDLASLADLELTAALWTGRPVGPRGQVCSATTTTCGVGRACASSSRCASTSTSCSTWHVIGTYRQRRAWSG